MGITIEQLDEGLRQELQFWSTYSSHMCESEKQTFALSKMGIPEGYTYNLEGKSILEVGGGPVGVSLRCVNGRRKIIDPLPYPDWVWERYDYFGVEYETIRAEDMEETGWDEVWVLNVLQHVDDLDLVLQKIKQSAKVLRIFEWLDIPTDLMHKHSLEKVHLDKVFVIDGHTEQVSQPYMYAASAYFGCYALNNEITPVIVTDLHQKWGGDMHRAMVHYIKATRGDAPVVVAEVGVLAGQSALITLETLNVETLYLVDPYTGYSTDTYTQKELDIARQAAIKLLAPYKDKIVWLPFSSLEAAKFFNDTGIRLDAAYLDGDHAYQPVLNDICTYMPLVKNDGVIGGHDFIDDIVEDNRMIQVKSAVIDYANQNDTPFFSCDFSYSDWWIDKAQLEV